ncbi:MAG: SGNH/GDSL hydrolase family protein [Anaerolineae bacterium]|nr:SGNH/GDSL hydrolase family protein [Anaerolineae bacterium]
MLFERHQRILFIGDSITDSDRAGAFKPYGNGYVSMVRSFMLARHPDYNLTFINKGVGGDTVRHLAARWERDVVAERPDWLSVMIGINDVWRHFAYNVAEAVPLDEYQARLRALLQRAREATGAKIILMQPYMIEPNQGNPMRQLMDVYGSQMELIANEFSAPLVRTQAAFDAVLANTPANFWSSDQIHPGGPGHAVIALAFLSTVGFAL